jgi:hypothetical protein
MMMRLIQKTRALTAAIGLLIMTAGTLGAMPDWSSYTNFKMTKELWICSSIAFPVDISYDAFNVAFRKVVQDGSGYFVQVIPGTHTNGNEDVSPVNVLNYNASGIFNPTGKPAGVYEYVFVSKTDDFCGMSNGEQAVVRIYVVPQVTGFPVLTNICPGGSETVDFNLFLPTEVKYFISEMGWKINFVNSKGVKVNMPVTVTLADVGENEYRYVIDDSQAGGYKDKYAELKQSPYFCPEDTAQITHTVRIRSGSDFVIPDRETAFCWEVLASVPETRDAMTVNLFGYLGSSVTGGIWNIVDRHNIDERQFPIDSVTGDVTIPVSLVREWYEVDANGQANPLDTLEFRYKYKDCDGKDTSSIVRFIFTDDFTSIIERSDTTEVCRNLVSGVIDLPATFGFSTPSTAGIWFVRDGVNPDHYTDMLAGTVDISALLTGSLYAYRYDISSAIDYDMCMVNGTSNKFHLRVLDAAFLSAGIQGCKSQVGEDGMAIDLFKYIPGLNDETRVNRNNVKWITPDGDTLGAAAAQNYTLTLPPEQLEDDANYTATFTYHVHSVCGDFEGNLVVSLVDSISDAYIHKTIHVCYTDSYAQYIDLAQVLGVAGLTGHFSYLGTKDLSAAFDPNTGIFDASRAFDAENSTVETFEFGYVNGSADECLANRGATVTVVVTKVPGTFEQLQ